jgi:murein DD-endopeptidase MepM/ murein hydrolase activator NlpD
MEYNFDNTAVALYSRNFAQGDAVLAEVVSSDPEITDSENPSIVFGGQTIPLVRKNHFYRCLFAIPPETVPGKTEALLRFTLDGETIERVMPLKVTDAHFKIFREPLDLGSFSNKSSKISPELSAFIDACTKKKSAAFAQMIPDQLDASLSHPRSMHKVTSEFYSKRVYLRYMTKGKKKVRLKDAVNPHNGLDLRGAVGEPIYAMARGKIGYAEPAYYEGNFVILNHGDGVFTYYMHMSKIIAKEGETVQAGQLIGEVGETGMVTGPHLHVSLMIHRIQADPTSLLCLPIRD